MTWSDHLLFYRDGLGFTTNGIIGTEFEYGAVVKVRQGRECPLARD